MIADTTFLIDLARRDSKAIEKAKELNEKGEVVTITVITLFEFWQSPVELTDRESALVSELTNKSLVIFLEPENAKVAGIIRRNLRKHGRQLSSRDSLIAGIVLSGNDVLITRNIKDFSQIGGLKIESY